MDTLIATHFVFLLSLFPALLTAGVAILWLARSRWGRARLIWIAAWGGRLVRGLEVAAARVPGLRRFVAWRARRKLGLLRGDVVKVRGKSYTVRKTTKKDTIVRRDYVRVEIPPEQIRLIRDGGIYAIVPFITSRIRKDLILRGGRLTMGAAAVKGA